MVISYSINDLYRDIVGEHTLDRSHSRENKDAFVWLFLVHSAEGAITRGAS